jgi:hypothetical protein
MGIGKRSPGVKRPICKAYRSPPPVSFKNEWRYTCTSTYAVMAGAGAPLVYFIYNFNRPVFIFCYYQYPTGCYSGIVFASSLVRIPFGICSILNDNFRGFSQAIHADTRLVPRLNHERFIPFTSFSFNRLTVKSHIDSECTEGCFCLRTCSHFAAFKSRNHICIFFTSAYPHRHFPILKTHLSKPYEPNINSNVIT